MEYQKAASRPGKHDLYLISPPTLQLCTAAPQTSIRRPNQRINPFISRFARASLRAYRYRRRRRDKAS
jgi:hypothetical protein